MKKHELQYALGKQVPAARYALTIHTDYGAIRLEGDDANYIADHLETLLEHKLNVGEYEEDA